LNDSHVGASTISSWIANGISPSEIQTLQSNQLIPLSAHNPTLWDWQADTGFKASNVMDMNAKAGTAFVLPLFTPKQTGTDYEAGVGQGSNYYFNISGFVGVKIVESPSKNSQLWVQPFAISDPNILFQSGSVVPLGAGSTTFSVIAPAKLTS
jgi:hypothetical protein